MLAGSAGACAFANVVRPDASLTCCIDTENACSIWAAVPLAGIVRWLAGTSPTVSPFATSSDSTADNASAVAPKRAANWGTVRYWRNSGEPGVETAVASACKPLRVLWPHRHRDVQLRRRGQRRGR